MKPSHPMVREDLNETQVCLSNHSTATPECIGHDRRPVARSLNLPAIIPRRAPIHFLSDRFPAGGLVRCLVGGARAILRPTPAAARCDLGNFLGQLALDR